MSARTDLYRAVTSPPALDGSLSSDETAALVARVSDLVGYRAIAEAVGVERTAVYRWAARKRAISPAMRKALGGALFALVKAAPPGAERPRPGPVPRPGA